MAGKIKIRSVSNWSIALTVILSVVCLAISLFGYSQYRVLRSAMQDYIACENAAHELQEGSDRLTKQVRLAAATGDTQYIDGYFLEANVTQTRQKALSDLARLDGSTDAIDYLQSALFASNQLMNTEYYAMRLVEESAQVALSLWPEELQAVSLSDEDAALPPAGKLDKAQALVSGVDYEDAKDVISGDVNAAIAALSSLITRRQSRAAEIFTDVFKKIIGCVFIFAALMLLVCLIMRRWVVHPLLAFHESIQKGTLFPIVGANELQSLAKTYNALFEENAERQRLMKHQAEHDPLTGLLNRGSFDRIRDLFERDGSDFALILLDVDTFKTVNDTYGHATGDAILKQVAGLLTEAFRNIDYVCRIGGDEFAVIMVNMTTSLDYTIADKIAEINRRLALGENGLPAVSVSAGAAFTDRKNPGKSLFADADSALYYTKFHGRCGCCFYPAEASH